MRNSSLRTAISLGFALPILAFNACGKRTEVVEKTTIIEKHDAPPHDPSFTISTKKKGTSVTIKP